MADQSVGPAPEGYERQIPTLIDLFTTCLRIGAITFGGGFAMMPILEREACDRHRWISHREIIDLFAVAQSVPGAVAMNTVMFLGMDLRGIPGASVALLGMVIPSFAIILAVASFLYRYIELPLVANAFGGIRAAVVALVVFATAKLASAGIRGPFMALAVVAAFVAVSVLHVHPALVILAGGLIGAMVQVFRMNKDNRDKGSGRSS